MNRIKTERFGIKQKNKSAIYIVIILIMACSSNLNIDKNQDNYLASSRYTDPLENGSMLENLPKDIDKICDIAKNQTVHHNLLAYYNVPASEWNNLNRLWKRGTEFPSLFNILSAIKDSEPYDIYQFRKIKDRLIGGCILESTFLTGLLRNRNIPSRIRAGYFKDTMQDTSHIIKFWENISRERGIEKELLSEDHKVWQKVMNRITRENQIIPNKHIEHWICEYWDNKENRWRLLDANNAFLDASSNIKVGYHLPKKHFEFAFEAWQKMRNSDNFDSLQYAEWPQDGRSHIRSQLLFDFFNLLNHDLAGYDNQNGDAYEFIKRTKYSDLSISELNELDSLSELLSSQPVVNDLIDFYLSSNTLKLPSAENDIYSFVYKGSKK